jgi:hypothetical protein
MIEPPVAIMLTLPKAFFDDREMSVEEFLPLFERHMQQDESLWYFKKKNLPVHDVAFCYIVFGGKVQFKTNVVMYERNKTYTFRDAKDKRNRTFENCNWIILCGPATKAPYEITNKGFQGFRYLTTELW